MDIKKKENYYKRCMRITDEPELIISKDEITDKLEEYGCTTVKELSDLLLYTYAVDLIIEDE